MAIFNSYVSLPEGKLTAKMWLDRPKKAGIAPRISELAQHICKSLWMRKSHSCTVNFWPANHVHIRRIEFYVILCKWSYSAIPYSTSQYSSSSLLLLFLLVFFLFWWLVDVKDIWYIQKTIHYIYMVSKNAILDHFGSYSEHMVSKTSLILHFWY